MEVDCKLCSRLRQLQLTVRGPIGHVAERVLLTFNLASFPASAQALLGDPAVRPGWPRRMCRPDPHTLEDTVAFGYTPAFSLHEARSD